MNTEFRICDNMNADIDASNNTRGSMRIRLRCEMKVSIRIRIRRRTELPADELGMATNSALCPTSAPVYGSMPCIGDSICLRN